ncbi:MAG: ribonuclease HI [Anaerolineae bacterium]|nr:ribonuclease HI [Anaerolineae bacterium]
MTDKPICEIYTDGCCIGNPGRGGYAAILMSPGERKELSGGFRQTTNSRMELMAAIAGLQTLQHPARVRLYSDSRYLVDAMQRRWAKHWRDRGWRRTGKRRVENVDLWKQLIELDEKHEVLYVWVKGHDGCPENERCDTLAMQAAMQTNLPPDRGYETPSPAIPTLFDNPQPTKRNPR